MADTFALLGKYFKKEITIDELDKSLDAVDDINAFDSYGTNALMQAINANDMELLERLLLKPGINVNAEKNGRTALSNALVGAIYFKQNNVPAINLLVSKGADVNQRDINYLIEGFENATSQSFYTTKMELAYKPDFKTDEWKICAGILEIVTKIPGIDLRKVEAAALSNIFSSSISQKVKEDYFYPLYFILNPAMPFSYPGMPKPMFSDKSLYLCATDALFPILFESEEFRPFFYEKIPTGPPTTDCCIVLPETATAKANIKKLWKNTLKLHTADAEKYIGVLGAAKQRYDRITISTPFVSPRRGSISNNLWKGMHNPLKCDESYKGMYTADLALFLESLLSRNILGISGLRKYNIRVFQNELKQGGGIPESFDFKKVRAFIVGIYNITSFNDGHFLGFYRFKDKWILVDNGIGYLHEIQDTQWFNDIFLPRLKNTINDPTLESADKKVFLQGNSSLFKYYLYYQFITIGARSYPNMPMVFGSGEKYMYWPISLVTISREDTEEASAPAAPVAPVAVNNKPAGGAGNTRRGRRKMARRTRRRRC